MSEFNQGAYDAFLSSIADLTSRDLARKKLRKSYMETNMIKMPERLMDAYNGGDYVGGGAVGFSRINDYIYKINDDVGVPIKVSHPQYMHLVDLHTRRLDTADVSRLILVRAQLLQSRDAVCISATYGDGCSIVHVRSSSCG